MFNEERTVRLLQGYPRVRDVHTEGLLHEQQQNVWGVSSSHCYRTNVPTRYPSMIVADLASFC